MQILSHGTPAGASEGEMPTISCDVTTIERADKDDWRCVTNPAERRRRQNRLNQRAYKTRRRWQVQVVRRSPGLPEADTEVQALENFTTSAHRCYVLGRPRIDHLSVLAKANVYRAFLQNITVLGLVADGICKADHVSPFNQIGPSRSNAIIFPPSLRPTSCQRSVPHHPWIDFFPHPTVRDNLIRSQGRYDKHEFCLDIMGFWNSNNALGNMLLVWGEPHDPENWEVTEGFIKKWVWVIQGCPDILRSTNKWRALRGEPLIFRYL